MSPRVIVVLKGPIHDSDLLETRSDHVEQGKKVTVILGPGTILPAESDQPWK